MAEETPKDDIKNDALDEGIAEDAVKEFNEDAEVGAGAEGGGDTETPGDSTTAESGIDGEKDLEKIANEIGGEDWVREALGERLQGEQLEGEHLEGEHVEGEHVEGEEKKALGEGEEVMGEQMAGEELEGEEEKVQEEQQLEEEIMEEEPPPDPSAPYDFTDSKEALKAPFELRPDQLAEVETLWELYQQATPAYTDINGFVTPVELVYLLKCLLLMTYTPEQMQELIEYCVRPPHPDGHINFDQFVKMVTLRQRDMPIEEELRMSLEVMDPERTGIIDREYLREIVGTRGNKMPSKLLDNFIKEVDMSNDGTIGVEDVVGTLCIDLNRDDIIMLQNQLEPPKEMDSNIDNLV